ncbi:PQQ-dependent sugar dehydrogenase [Polyangium aurulentum]|nr:PQQ-dependent sugar dehydrogenase [Polyangium aurulentum]
MDSLSRNSRITWGLVVSLGLASLALGAGACGDDGKTGGSSNTGGAGGTGGGNGGAGGTGGTGGGNGGAGGTGGAGGGNVVCDPGTSAALPALKLTEVANNLQRPTFVLGAPEDTSRLFVLEKPGRIRILKDGNLVSEPFIDVTNVVEAGANERGLLGLAFHPKYPQNGRFYIYYTRKGDGAIEIAEYMQVAGTPDKADPGSAKVLMTIPHPSYSNHNGGMLGFGPDGFLYVGTGDGGGGGDPDENGQDANAQLGKLLRIDVDSHPTPPPGNMAGGDPYIWDLGLRNPWRFSFDRCTGDLYIADVGQNLWEEINVEPKGQGSKNYGWNTMEANECFDPANDCDKTGLTMPVTAYKHTPEPVNDCSVTGGYVYRGKKIAGLVGTYVYADYCSRRVYTLAWANGSVIKEGEITADLESTGLSGGITSFGEDTAGELYVVMDNSQGGPGKLFRIDPE